MQLLLGFAPFLLFVALSRLSTILVALAVNAAIAALLVILDLRRGRVRILDIGSFVLFALLTLGAFGAPDAITMTTARLAVDAGLLAIVLVSIAVRQPFTLAYAREQVPEARWSDPRFLRANDRISAVWALAFALSFAINLAATWDPTLPLFLRSAGEIVAFGGAIVFTRWYPRHLRAKASAAHLS